MQAAGSALMLWAIIRMAFSADYDAAPDVALGRSHAATAIKASAFRGAEKIYEIMQAAIEVGDKKMWATEFGWLTRPPDPIA